MLKSKEYKIRRGLNKYNYVVSIPESIVEQVGLNAKISYELHEKDGKIDAIVMFIKKQGEPLNVVKQKPGPKKKINADKKSIEKCNL